jgi:hypothetical protein
VKSLVASFAVIACVASTGGCKYPDPGFGTPGDDDPTDDADVDDGMTDDDMELERCPAFSSVDNKMQLPGIQVAGFSVTEDESFAISFLHANTIGYTLGPDLGAAYMMTDLPNNVIGAHVLGDGSALYFIDYNASSPRLFRSINAGSPATWNAATVSGLPDHFPGRPTDDDQRVAFADESRGYIYEWERVVGTWTPMTTYAPADFGLDSTTEFLSANLSPDARFLVYAAGGGDPYGIYYRIRGSGGTFSAADGGSGGRIVDGTYDQPHLTLRCSHLFARNVTTNYVERFDVLP